MEESGGNSRQEHARPQGEFSGSAVYPGARGDNGGGGSGAAASGSGDGWTDMFQGMTVEVSNARGAALGTSYIVLNHAS